jgi:hypothetical protein
MAHGVNNDLVPRRFVKDEIGIRRDWQAPDQGVIGPRAYRRVKRQKIDESLKAGLNTPRPPGRLGSDGAKDRF